MRILTVKQASACKAGLIVKFLHPKGCSFRGAKQYPTKSKNSFAKNKKPIKKGFSHYSEKPFL